MDSLKQLYLEVFGDLRLREKRGIPVGVFCGMEESREKTRLETSTNSAHLRGLDNGYHHGSL